jgi:hypothetical protein
MLEIYTRKVEVPIQAEVERGRNIFIKGEPKLEDGRDDV